MKVPTLPSYYGIAKSWNALMKQKLCLFAIYQAATNLQRTENLNLELDDIRP
jgi:hypothetical protein